MRFFLLFLTFISLLSCNDGNFEVPSFEFQTTVNVCGDYVVYRVNDDKTEALVIQLSDEVILPGETTMPIKIPINSDNVQYRIFSGALPDNYFCSDIPPEQPAVLRNWRGVVGDPNSISIETTAVTDANDEITGYEHQITLNNLILESNDEKMLFETYDFGSFIISL